VASRSDTHPIVASWVGQILDPEIQDLVERSNGQIEVRLFANAGKVRKRPMILLHAGPQPNEDV
jgi:hypothetical protein